MKYRVTQSTMTMETFDVEASSESDAVAQAAGRSDGTLVSHTTASSAVPIGASPAPMQPLGFGVYLRRLVGDPEEAAANCVRGGIAWAALMVEASDGYTEQTAMLRKWAEVLRRNNIQVGVWSFPGDDRAQSVETSRLAAQLLTGTAAALDAQIIAVDIEAPYKGKPEQTRALVDEIIETAPAGAVIGGVSYPIPSAHPTLDWGAFEALDWGSPMFYTSASEPALVERGMTEWRKLTPVIVPSLDGWRDSGLEGAARFEQDILRVCGEPPPRVPAALVWSERQMDGAKRAVTKSMGTKYGWPQP